VRRWLAEGPVAAYRAYVAEFTRRVEARPDVPEYREQLARNHTNLGLVLTGMDRHAESEEALRAAVSQYEALCAEYPAATRYRAELATCLIHYSRVLMALQRPDEAQQVQQQAIAAYDRLMATNPRDYRTNLASVMITLMPGADQPIETPGDTAPSSILPGQSSSSAASEAVITPPSTAPPTGRTDRRNDELPAERRARFTMLRHHASGGASRILIARDHDLNREVAIKELLPAIADNPEVRRRFLQEAQLTAQLEHPHIIPIYGLGYRSQDDVPFIIMRFLDGQTLKEAIDAYHRAPTNGELRRLLQAYDQACQALAYAHARGVIHRDPKPSNILLGKNGEVAVADWGIAKLCGTHESDEDQPQDQRSPALNIAEWANPSDTFEGTVMGTPAYMAPEMASGNAASVDQRSDVYVLGASLFQLLTGQPPYRGKEPLELLHAIAASIQPPLARAIKPSVPPALDAICAHAMAPKPADRYPSAAELHHDVCAWLEGGPVSAYPETGFRRLMRSVWSGSRL
jgi:serine/threonine protein kinase